MAEKLAHILKRVALALLYIMIYLGLQRVLFETVIFNEGDGMNYSGVVTIVSALAAMGILSVICYLRGQRITTVVRFKRVSLLDVVLAFSLSVGFRMLTYVYFVWAEDSIPVLEKSLEQAKELTYNMNTMTNIGIITIVAAIYVVAPIFEEILFRGLVQKELSEAFGVVVAILVQGFLFGAAHGILVQSVFAAVYGCLLGAVYFKTKNISITILSHMFFNLSSVLEIKTGVVLHRMVLAGFCMTVVSILIFFYAYRKKHTPSDGVSAGGNNNG